MKKQTQWNLIAAGAAVAASFLARRSLERAWSKTAGRPPPRDPELAENGVTEALLWSLAVAGAAGVARLLGRRGAAGAWRLARGEDPPKKRG